LRASLIYNPTAGSRVRDRGERLRRAVKALRDAGIDVDEAPTNGPSHATDLACRLAAQGTELIIAAGGDGTINEVANGMIGSESRLAILPAGTANVLACEMRIPRDIEAAARAIPRLVPRRIAVGRFSPQEGDARYFLLMAGAGMDAAIAGMVRPDFKNRWGKLAYWFAGLSQAGRKLPQMEASVHGNKVRTGFALAARARNYGGDLEIARNVTLMDSSFEIVLFRGETTWPFAKYLIGAVLGSLGAMSGITVTRSCCLDLVPIDSPIHVQLDGELAGQLPARIDIVQDALTLMTPADLPARYGQPDA
jgi:YegS/Rv2252/BmrU family lipid kinase